MTVQSQHSSHHRHLKGDGSRFIFGTIIRGDWQNIQVTMLAQRRLELFSVCESVCVILEKCGHETLQMHSCEMKAKVEDSCGFCKSTGVRKVGSGEGTIGPPIVYAPGLIWPTAGVIPSQDGL